jgi:glutaconate CoA-transferase subunit A
MGVSFQPVRGHGSTDLNQVKHGKIIECPFTGKKICLAPAYHPDLAIVHVQATDIFGNSRIFGSLCSCPEIARAAENTIVTTEQIIPNSAIDNYPNLTEIPGSAVDAVVDQPFGSTPGNCYGHYRVDTKHLHEFREIRKEFYRTGKKDRLQEYYDKYIFSVETFDDYLEEKPYPVLKDLCHLEEYQPILVD